MNLNMEITIPEEVNKALNVLRALKGTTKKAIVTEALIHYVNCVGGETTNIIRRQQTPQRASSGGADSPSTGASRS